MEKHIWDVQTHMGTSGCQFLSTKDAWTSLKEKRKAKQGQGKRKEERKENHFLHVWLISERKRARLLLVFILIIKNENPKGKSFFSSMFLIFFFSASRLRLPSNDDIEGYISEFQQNEIINKHQLPYLKVIKRWQALHYLELKVFPQELKLKIWA